MAYMIQKSKMLVSQINFFMLNYRKGSLLFPSVSYIRIYHSSKETELIIDFLNKRFQSISFCSLTILACSNLEKNKQTLK